MAKLIQPANAGDNTAGLDDFTPIPAGKYPVIIKKSEFKQTKAKNGHFLKLQFTVIDGEHKGRSLFTNLNLDNPNPQAVEIANKALNSICQACNKVGVEDSEELHGIPMLTTVQLKTATATNPASNELKFFEPIEGAGKTETSTQDISAGDEKKTETKSGKLPWEK